jgi:hypothetical protein
MDLNVVRMSFVKKVFSRDIRILVLRGGIRVTTYRKKLRSRLIRDPKSYFPVAPPLKIQGLRGILIASLTNVSLCY